MSSTQAAAAAAAVEDSEEEADDYCDVFDAEEWQIRHLSVGEHAVEEQRTPEQRPATSSVSWRQWTPSFKLLQRFKEGLSTVRHMQAETGKLTQVPQMLRTHSLAQTPALHVRDSTSFLNRTLSQQQQQAHSLEHPARSAMQMGQQGPPDGFPNGWEAGHMKAVRISIPKDNHCLFNSIAYLCCDGVQVAVTESTCRFLIECLVR
jgi:hypothetical protein